MSPQDIVNKIVSDGNYMGLCRKLVGTRQHLADDLFQETTVQLLEVKDNRLVEALNGGYLDVYIVGVINNLWHQRTRVKTHHDGATSQLMEYSSSYNCDVNARWETKNPEFVGHIRDDEIPTAKFKTRRLTEASIKYDHRIDGFWTAAKKIIKEDCDSMDKTTMYRARVFNYSHDNVAGLPDIKSYPNPMQFSSGSGIPYSAVIKTCTKYKETLRERLKHIWNG